MLQAAKDLSKLLMYRRGRACFSSQLIIAVKYAEFLSFPTTLSPSSIADERWFLF